MYRARTFLMLIGCLVLTCAAACGSSPSGVEDVSAVTPDVIIHMPTALPSQEFIVPTDVAVTLTPVFSDYEIFNAAAFGQSAEVTNPWLPLKPGTQYIYEGNTENNGVAVEHRLVVSVTDLTKVINGVVARVTFDQDFKAGEMVESELAFYAQDAAGNVWRMGEHPEEYENGEFVEAPTWFGGVLGSVAGIEMLGGPRVGTPSYSQGWAPSVEFTDRGQVSDVGQQVCVPAGCYKDVLVIDETSRAEPGAHQLKLFVQDVGNVKVDWRGADQTQEILELVRITQLNADQLAEIRAQALAEEQHAYQVSQDVYGQTLPMQ